MPTSLRMSYTLKLPASPMTAWNCRPAPNSRQWEAMHHVRGKSTGFTQRPFMRFAADLARDRSDQRSQDRSVLCSPTQQRRSRQRRGAGPGECCVKGQPACNIGGRAGSSRSDTVGGLCLAHLSDLAEVEGPLAEEVREDRDAHIADMDAELARRPQLPCRNQLGSAILLAACLQVCRMRVVR